MGCIEAGVHLRAQGCYLCIHVLLQALILPSVEENAHQNCEGRDANREQNLCFGCQLTIVKRKGNLAVPFRRVDRDRPWSYD